MESDFCKIEGKESDEAQRYSGGPRTLILVDPATRVIQKSRSQ